MQLHKDFPIDRLEKTLDAKFCKMFLLCHWQTLLAVTNYLIKLKTDFLIFKLTNFD